MIKKKLAIFINSLEHGGAQKIASVLVKELSKEFDIHLVLIKNKTVYDLPKGTKILELQQNHGRTNIFTALLNVYRYNKLCKKNNIDISLSLLTQANYISILSKIFGSGAKTVVSEHTYQSLWRVEDFWYARLKKVILRILYNRADKVITVSKKIENDLMVNFGVKQNKLVTIYNPYKIDEIAKLSEMNPKSVDFSNKFTFITIGTLYSVKNHELLIRAFSKLELPNVQLVIVGDGELRNYLEELVHNLGLKDKVVFVGFTKNPFMYIAKSEVFVLSSNNEGLPNVIIEALACKSPVISTDCISGPREILAPNTSIDYQNNDGVELVDFGVLVPIKNEKLLSEALLRLVKDTDLLNKYKEKAWERASYFNSENSIKQYIRNLQSA